MHLIIFLVTVVLVWRYADWRNWEKYHTTMLFFAAGNLMYNFIAANYLLWEFKSDFFSNHTLTELGYTLIVFPGTVLLFLSNLPNTVSKQILYILKWLIVYLGLEWLALEVFGGITHQYGWNMWWSVAFDSVMFPLLWLHHKRPLLAYLVAFLMGLFITLYFDIPVEVPIELRK